MGTATATQARYRPQSAAGLTQQRPPAGQLRQQPQGIIPGAMVGHGGWIYEVLSVAGNMALCRWPGATGPGYVFPYGLGYPVPALAAFPVATLRSFPVPQIPPAPKQTGDGIGPGAIVRWGTSLGQWVVLSIDGNTAQCRQVSGYAQAMVWDVELEKLSLWDDGDFATREKTSTKQPESITTSPLMPSYSYFTQSKRNQNNIHVPLIQ